MYITYSMIKSTYCIMTLKKKNYNSWPGQIFASQTSWYSIPALLSPHFPVLVGGNMISPDT